MFRSFLLTYHESLCFGGGVLKSRGWNSGPHSTDQSFIWAYVVRKQLTLSNAVNALETSFPTFIMRLAYTCPDGVGQGAPK